MFSPTHTLIRRSTFAVALSALSFACAEDLTPDPRVQPSDAVTARFDPTNPISVLQIVPAPTGLVQDPMTGAIDFDAVAPEPCEGQSTAQCLPLLGFDNGWPTSVNPTLVFESEIDVASATAGGIQLFAVTASAAQTVDFTVTQRPLPPPPAACQEAFGYDQAAEDAFASNVEVTLVPQAAGQPASLMPGTRYVVVVTKALMAAPIGDGTDLVPVEPSSLFYALTQSYNRDDQGAPIAPPVFISGQDMNGDPLFEARGSLQTSVLASVVAGVDAGIAAGQIPAEQRDAVIAAQLQDSYQGLFGLFQFFNGAIAAVGADPNDLAFINTWTTGVPAGSGATQTALFDPLAADPVVPFPNDPLLTNVDPEDPTDVVLDLPNDPNGSPLQQGLIAGLGTLNGWSTVAPISVPMSAQVDEATLANNVLVVPYTQDGANLTVGAPHPIRVTPTPNSLVIQPLVPLAEDQTYAVGVRGGPNGVATAGGETFGSESLFDLLKGPSPVITGTTAASADPDVAAAVGCGFFLDNGRFPSEPELVGTLLAIEDTEDGLGRSRFQPAFRAFEDASIGIPRTEMAMAFTYKTQSITELSDQVQALIDAPAGGYDDAVTDMVPVDAALVPGFEFVGPAAQGFICQSLCQVGLFQIPVAGSTPVAPAQCDAATNPDVTAHALCAISASNVGRVALYSTLFYDLTEGTPFGSGGTFTPGAIAAPRAERSNVWVITPAGMPPAGGFPAQLFTHGLTQDKQTGLLLVNSFAQQGWATVLVDLPFHGDRSSDLINNATGDSCPTIDPDDVTCTPGTDTCMNGCDGVRDPDGTGFIGLNLFATRDNFRESSLDVLTVLDHLRDGEFAGANLSTTEHAISGQSLGSLVTGIAAAFVDETVRVGLSATGGGLTTIILESIPDFNQTLFAALAAAGVCDLVVEGDPSSGCLPTPGFQQFLLLAQTVLDPGDSLANSVGVARTMNGQASSVLTQIIRNDKVVTENAGFALAAAYGYFDGMMPLSDRLQLFDFDGTPGQNTTNGCHGALLTFGDPLSGLCGTSLNDAVCRTYGQQSQLASFFETGMVTAQTPAMVGPVTCN